MYTPGDSSIPLVSMSSTDSSTILTPQEAAFRRLLTDHILRYPQLEIQDLYKLIFQASFGSEHAVAYRTAAYHPAYRVVLYEFLGR